MRPNAIHSTFAREIRAAPTQLQKIIENVSQERDLGVLIKGHIDGGAHVTKVVSKANSLLGMVWRTYECKSMKNIIQLYKILV